VPSLAIHESPWFELSYDLNGNEHQNESFTANWTMRGFAADAKIFPKDGLAVGFTAVGSP
jgi:hypothetical protein